MFSKDTLLERCCPDRSHLLYMVDPRSTRRLLITLCATRFCWIKTPVAL